MLHLIYKLFSICKFDLIDIRNLFVLFPECIDIYKLEKRNEEKKQRKRLINFVILHIEEI